MAFLTNKLFIMQKFLKITNAPVDGQLISLEGIKTVATNVSGVATTVTIKYNDATTTTVTTAAQVASDVYLLILNSIESAIATSWQKGYYEVALPKAVASILNT